MPVGPLVGPARRREHDSRRVRPAPAPGREEGVDDRLRPRPFEHVDVDSVVSSARFASGLGQPGGGDAGRRRPEAAVPRQAAWTAASLASVDRRRLSPIAAARDARPRPGPGAPSSEGRACPLQSAPRRPRPRARPRRPHPWRRLAATWPPAATLSARSIRHAALPGEHERAAPDAYGRVEVARHRW